MEDTNNLPVSGSADWLISKLSEVAPGHEDASGKLDPDLVYEEIKNKLNSINFGLNVLEKEGKVGEAIKTLVSLYPDKVDLMKEEIKGIKLEKYSDFFE